MKRTLLLLLILICTRIVAQNPAGSSGQYPPPVKFTVGQDHQNMMDQLGIKSLRQGPSGNESAPNHANYNESIANPYPDLPDLLTLKNGKKVTTPDIWWKQRRPEIVEDMEKEVYGRLPKKIPAVKWTVEISEREMVGFIPVIAKKLTGHVDNSEYPLIDVNISMVLVTPANARGPVPVLMMFGMANLPAPAQPNGTHIFELSDEQVEKLTTVYERMFEEINSDYIHKYDVLRNLVFELLHFAMKIQPSTNFDKQQINASKRISVLFLELLERQFPIDDLHQRFNLRSASDFANQLNIHVNHLNRAVKETTQKTTSQIIAERIMQESKILLKHSNWSVSEIAYALGFTEVTHFNNFFKKHVQLSPLKFRNF